MNVARATLDELLLDFEDFLRQRNKWRWDKNDPAACEVRAVGMERDRTHESDRIDRTDHKKKYSRWLNHADPTVIAIR